MEKVSKLVDGGIESKYFNVKCRPKGGMASIDIKCSFFLTYMALADITRDKKEINELTIKFWEILLECKNLDDFMALQIFMNTLSSVGGYATEFYDKVHGLINFVGKNRAEELLQVIERQKVLNDDGLSIFKQNFVKLNTMLYELKQSNIRDENKILFLLKKYYELKASLYDLACDSNKDFIFKYDEKLEEPIRYLKRTYKEI